MDLFAPFQLGPYSLPNRLVMGPMTRSRTGPGNVPTALTAIYYAQRASAGLIVTEATHISPQGAMSMTSSGIHTPDQTAGWRRVTAAVHEAGGRIFLQLWHVGRISHTSIQPDGALPVAPSAIAARCEKKTATGEMRPLPTPRALDIDEIPGLIDQYRRAAASALAAGFDGVEIHSANGFLIDQFLRDGSNHRADRYGGSAENRARFLFEVTEAVAKVWGGERVGVHLSPTTNFNDMFDSDPAHTLGVAADGLNAFGLTYLHLVEGVPGSPMAPAEGMPRLAPMLRKIFRGALILNGGYTRASANAAIAAGQADLISFAVNFLANPDLPERLRRDAPLNVPDRATFYSGGAKGYTDYPTLDQMTTSARPNSD
jgi:N-ethylmaleimide reductase